MIEAALTLGETIDSLKRTKDEKKMAELVVDEICDRITALELELMERMTAHGVVKTTGSLATVSIQESIKPSVKDWPAFYAFIQKNQYFHLLERRPAVAGCRELFETRGVIPGVEPFTLRTLRVTSL